LSEICDESLCNTSGVQSRRTYKFTVCYNTIATRTGSEALVTFLGKKKEPNYTYMEEIHATGK
jgi:hypothetical protein